MVYKTILTDIHYIQRDESLQNQTNTCEVIFPTRI